MTALYNDIIFGPIHSRRLGLSLGVNLLPRIETLFVRLHLLRNAAGTPTIRAAAGSTTGRRLRACSATRCGAWPPEGTPPDVITFAGNGEADAPPEFEAVIDDTIALRDALCPSARVSVLSNATQLGREDVAAGPAARGQQHPEARLGIRRHGAPDQRTGGKLPGIAGGGARHERFDGRLIVQTMFLRGTYEGRTHRQHHRGGDGLAAADRRDPPEAGHGLLARPRHTPAPRSKGRTRRTAPHRRTRRSARHPLLRGIGTGRTPGGPPAFLRESGRMPCSHRACASGNCRTQKARPPFAGERENALFAQSMRFGGGIAGRTGERTHPLPGTARPAAPTESPSHGRQPRRPPRTGRPGADSPCHAAPATRPDSTLTARSPRRPTRKRAPRQTVHATQPRRPNTAERRRVTEAGRNAAAGQCFAARCRKTTAPGILCDGLRGAAIRCGYRTTCSSAGCSTKISCSVSYPRRAASCRMRSSVGADNRGVRQNPQPLRRAAAHQRPVVLLAQLQHVVVGIEKPEERHPQPPPDRRSCTPCRAPSGGRTPRADRY